MFASSASGSAVAEFNKCPVLGLNIRNFSRVWLLKAEFQSLVSLVYGVSLALVRAENTLKSSHLNVENEPGYQPVLKGIIHPKVKILTAFTPSCHSKSV